MLIPLPRRCSRHVITASLLTLTCTLFTRAQTDVLTWHNDGFRTGQNQVEAILTPAAVNASRFGLLADIVVDGKVDAQPLYVSALALPSKVRSNVLFVATEHDTVYALNADTGAELWHKSLLNPGETPSDDRNCSQVTPEIGITATPAIDRSAGPNGTIYVVGMSKDGSGNYYQRIHALNLVSGAEEFNGPATVHATYPGTGDGSSGGRVSFDPKQYKERPGLLLANGTLYTSWGSHCDIRPYAGWLMSYDAKTLAQKGVLDFVPNGSDAAPWNAGAGPAVDQQGYVYLSLGNGTFDTSLNLQGLPNQSDYGNSLVKVAPSAGGLTVKDYWTMYNSNSESDVDADLGSGGLMLLPDLTDNTGATRHLVIAAGKDHNLYVANRDSLGHFDANANSTLYQELLGALPGGEWSSPAYFNSRVYYGSVGQRLQSFELSAAKLINSPQATSTLFGYPGTTPSISAFGTTSGIVWAPENSSPAVLHAYDADNLSTELYNSNQAANSRDHFGNGNKFIVPTIANGKVYVGTQNSVAIFGLIHKMAAPLPDGDYTLTNNQSKLVLDDPGFTNVANAAMYQWGANGGLNQEWFLSYGGNGFYTIQNVASKLFLTDANGSGAQGIPLQQNLPAHDGTQLWAIKPTAQGFVIQNKLTGLVVDDSGNNPIPGPSMILWSPNSGFNQAWTIR